MICRLAMDLGTAKTVIADAEHGILCKQPSLVGYDKGTGKPVAVGSEAARLMGRTPRSIVIKRPLKAGRIDDFEAAALMLQGFLRQLSLRPKQVEVVVGIPLRLTAAEKLALRHLFRAIGIRRTRLVEEHIATAAHAELNLLHEYAGILIDVGAGLTELALLGSGTVLASRSLNGSDALQQAIEGILVERYALRPSRSLVEGIQARLWQADSEEIWEYRGFHLQDKRVRRFTLERMDFSGLIATFYETIHAALVEMLAEEGLPPHDPRLVDAGILLTGSAMPLDELRGWLEQRTGLGVQISSQPDESVVRGLRAMLSYADYF